MNRDFEDLGGADPYELLGVRQDADATGIQRAHRRLAQRIHPDTGGDAESLKRLNLAREVLLDPARRMTMDERLRQRQGRGGAAAKDASPPEPQPQAPPYQDQFDWSYGTGPDQEPPKPQAPSPEDQFDWTYGTGPSSYDQRPRYAQSAYTQPVYQQSAYQYQYTARSTYRYRRRWSRMAIAALVIAFLFWPAGLPMGIRALVRARRRNERGASLAWIAIGWSLVALCVAAIHYHWI